MPTLLTDVAGVFASLSSFRVLFQAARITKEGAEGVSVATWALGAFASGLWVAYGAVFSVPGEYVGNGVYLLGSLLVLASCHRAGIDITRTAVAAAAGWVVCLVPSLVWTWLLGPVAIAVGTVSFLPQVFIRADDLKGVSEVTWVWTFVASVAWLVYGIGLNKVPVWLPNMVTIPASVAIVVRVALSRRRRARPALA